LINNAYIKIFLVTGQNKAETLKQVLNEKTLPTSKIDGNVIWILDEQSASQLEF
jgi:6-phosphogluconolactonase/glucosamine-6-phosphate isomerase/deaminase